MKLSYSTLDHALISVPTERIDSRLRPLLTAFTQGYSAHEQEDIAQRVIQSVRVIDPDFCSEKNIVRFGKPAHYDSATGDIYIAESALDAKGPLDRETVRKLGERYFVWRIFPHAELAAHAVDAFYKGGLGEPRFDKGKDYWSLFVAGLVPFAMPEAERAKLGRKIGIHARQIYPDEATGLRYIASTIDDA